MKKPRSDSKLKSQLAPEKRAQLADWLLSGMPYYKAKALVKKEFNVSTSLRGLSDFWDDYCSVELIRQRREAVSLADELATEASKDPGRFDEATIDAIKQRAFELSVSPHAAPGDVRKLFMLVLKKRDQDLEEIQINQKIREYEDRITATDRALKKAAAKGGITKNTLQEIEQELGLL